MATNEDLNVRIGELLEELAAEKKKAKEKEAAEAWTKAAAISIVVIAVLGALAAQRSGSYGTRSLKHLNKSIFEQVSASNKWAQFQAKSTKANIYEAALEQMRIGGASAEGAPPERAKAAADIEARVKRYKQEQEEISAEARALEHKRDEADKASAANGATGASLGIATLLLQVAVAVVSICVVTKRKMLWYAALAIAAAATADLVYTLLMAPVS